MPKPIDLTENNTPITPKQAEIENGPKKRVCECGGKCAHARAAALEAAALNSGNTN